MTTTITNIFERCTCFVLVHTDLLPILRKVEQYMLNNITEVKPIKVTMGTNLGNLYPVSLQICQLNELFEECQRHEVALKVIVSKVVYHTHDIRGCFQMRKIGTLAAPNEKFYKNRFRITCGSKEHYYLQD